MIQFAVSSESFATDAFVDFGFLQMKHVRGEPRVLNVGNAR